MNKSVLGFSDCKCCMWCDIALWWESPGSTCDTFNDDDMSSKTVWLEVNERRKVNRKFQFEI